MAKIKYMLVTDANQMREKGITQLPMLEADGMTMDFSEALVALRAGELNKYSF